jgi:hypothetical protein
LNLRNPWKKRPRIAFGYIAGSSVTVHFERSLSALRSREERKGGDMLLAGIIRASGLYLDNNRNKIVEIFLADKNRAEWLLQVDTDVDFQPDLLETLMELVGDRKFLGLSVPLGEWATTAFRLRTWEEDGKPDGMGWEVVTEFPGGFAECDGVAGAIHMVHRSVYEAVQEKYGHAWYNLIHLEKNPGSPMRDRTFDFQGEDLSFCLRVKAIGVQAHCAVIRGLGHHKTRRLTHDEPERVPNTVQIVHEKTSA